MIVDVKVILARPIVPQSICLVLILLMIWQISAGFFSFFSLDKSSRVRHDQVTEKKVEAKKDSSHVGLNTAFFGDYVPNNLNDADVKQSMLDLKVVGIMFANNEEASHVIIRTAGGREQTFGVGDSLPGGAVIKRVTPDGVLIGRNGALESLSLPKNALTFDPPAKPLGFSK